MVKDWIRLRHAGGLNWASPSWFFGHAGGSLHLCSDPPSVTSMGRGKRLWLREGARPIESYVMNVGLLNRASSASPAHPAGARPTGLSWPGLPIACWFAGSVTVG